MNMNNTLRTAIPLLLLVGLALMTPTAAAEPVTTGLDLDHWTCRIVEVKTTTINIGTIATIHGQTICV